MKSIPLFALALASAAMAAGDRPEDLLRFSNDDQLHGNFEGFENGSISWHRKDVAAPIQINASTVRQVVLHSGRPLHNMDSPSYARLVGGDRVPGTIVSLDEKTLTLETPYAGRLTIPRNHIDTLSPVPFGGRVRYAGPFTPEGWRILENKEEPKENAGEKDGEDKNTAPDNADENNATEKKEQPEPTPAWVFARTAWYSAPAYNDKQARIPLRGRNINQPQKAAAASPLPLVLDNILGDAASLRFHLAWKNQLGIYIAFHSDLAKAPDPKNPDAEKAKRASFGNRSLPYNFGNSYAFALTSSYGMFYSCGFEKDGKPFTKRLKNASFNKHGGQVNEMDVELRFDRTNGRILLFIDGEFRMQLDEDPDEWPGKGSAIGFLVTNTSCQIRISDILVTDWNGRIDSARSMETENRDIVLLTNGTDRFSGKIQSIKENIVSIKGNYATMRVPLGQISEIHFARESIAKPNKSASDQISLKLHPLGRISGKPLRASRNAFSITSPHFGDAEIQLDFVNILDFKSSTNFIDEWDIDF
jgi:hypothetical protein